MKTRASDFLIAALAALSLAGCGLGSYDLCIQFPDDRAKERVVEIQIWLLDAVSYACEPLQDGTVDPETADFFTHMQLAYPLPEDARLRQVPMGSWLFAAEGRDASGARILRGCTRAEVQSGKRTEVLIELAWVCEPNPAGEIPGNGLDDDCDGQTDECLTDDDCDDGQGCTTDDCRDGVCDYTRLPNGIECDDGDPCTEDDACSEGNCEGAQKDCSALDAACSHGVCNRQTGLCEAETLDGQDCDDGQWCTVGDICAGDICQGQARECDDDDDCTVDTCDEADDTCRFTLQPRPGEEGPPGDASCSNGVDDDCDRDTDGEDANCHVCIEDADCDDTNECTDDRCESDACVNEPVRNGTECDLGLYCTPEPTCQNGSCVGAERDCSLLDSDCAEGICSESLRDCVESPLQDGLPCDDGDPCSSLDTCRSGECSAGPVDLDADGDGFFSGVCGGDDCDDGAPGAHPLTSEVGEPACSDGLDNDCDGQTDGADPSCAELAGLCTPDGWCWMNPRPFGYNLRAIYAAAPDDVWAVGAPSQMGDLAAHWNGVSWSLVDIGSDEGLNDIHGAGPNEVWAAGVYGHAFRWDGHSWSGRQTPLYPVKMIWVSASDDVWASTSDELAHWDGSSWTEYENYMFFVADLWAEASGDAWAVGGDGEAYRYRAGAWEPWPTQSAEDLYAVWGSGPDDVWAGGYGGALQHWDGSAWSAVGVTGGYGHFYALWGAASDRIWATERQRIYRYNGSSWSQSGSFELGFLQGLHGSSQGDVWACGGAGALVHFDGADWSTLTTGHQGEFRAAWSASPDAVWAVGNMGRVIRWDGSGWRDMSPDNFSELQGIWGNSANDVWVVGGALFHCDAGACSYVDPGVWGDWTDVWTADDQVWIAGGSGTVLHFDGASWVEEPVGPGDRFEAVWGTSNQDVWLAGCCSGLYHWNGSEWTNYPSTMYVQDIWGTGSSNVFAVGSSISRWDGSQWVDQGVSFSGTLFGVHGASGTNVWAVGESAYRFSGTNWTRETQPADTLQGVHVDAAGHVWVVGWGGAILRR
ncbi:MAG: putative metal-binding motif-containing protein [Deltaproteobacteria bacterium]|nr:putative metal-binding motif-containing protein [Deltaproteobacteria bacterium]